jgi:predicted nucleic acid-binding protein
VAAEQWGEKAQRKGNLAEFFTASPLRSSRLKLQRLSVRLALWIRAPGGEKQRRRLERLSNELPMRFRGRIPPIDVRVADTCGKLVVRESMGRPMEPRDVFIAATAGVHGLRLVTRNASDFEATVKDPGSLGLAVPRRYRSASKWSHPASNTVQV